MLSGAVFRRSGHQHDPADRGPVLQQPVGLRGLGQRQARPDVGAEPAVLEMPGHLGHLGPGPRERLLAFIDGVIEVVSRNKGLLAALDHAEAVVQAKLPDDEPPPLHALWHRHIADLIHQARPGLDADLTAHLILASLHSDPIQRLLVADGGADRLSGGLKTIIEAVLA